MMAGQIASVTLEALTYGWVRSMNIPRIDFAAMGWDDVYVGPVAVKLADFGKRRAVVVPARKNEANHWIGQDVLTIRSTVPVGIRHEKIAFPISRLHEKPHLPRRVTGQAHGDQGAIPQQINALVKGCILGGQWL